MNKLFNALRPFIQLVVKSPWIVLLIASLLTAFSVKVALNLTVDTNLVNLVPEDYESVKALEKLRATVGGESTTDIAIVSPSFEANKAFAETLIPQILTLTRKGETEPYFNRIDYKKDADFLENNALYFATPAELDELEWFLEDEIEKAVQEANPFYFSLDDDFDDEGEENAGLALQETYDRIVVKEYPISDDSTKLILKLYPTGSQSNIGRIDDSYADLQKLINEIDPAQFHAEMYTSLAGRPLRRSIEIKATTSDIISSFGMGVFSVLFAVAFYFAYKAWQVRRGWQPTSYILITELFRMPVAALLIAIPLLMSLSWTANLAYTLFETLNLMTATLGLVLFGLGIDFGIHFYARYTEERGEGFSPEEAAVNTFISTGEAITVSAFTTSAAMFVLTLADFKGFSQFGMVAGAGVLFALITMLTILPALTILFERFHLLNLASDQKRRIPKPISKTSSEPSIFPMSGWVVGFSILLTLVAGITLPRINFEYNFGKLEPVYQEYLDAQKAFKNMSDKPATSGPSKRNPGYIVVDNPSEVAEVVTALRNHAEKDTLSPTILSVESLQERFPIDEVSADEKLERIEYIRELLADKYIASQTSDELEKLRRSAATNERILISDVPESIRKPFTAKNGEVGNFVMVYPSVGLSDGLLSMQFSEDVGTVVTESGKTFHAGSSSLVAADMLRLMQEESPLMLGLTFALVLFFMILVFRSTKWTILSLIPLVIGLVWMFGLMELLDLRLNFYNLVVLPAVLGIGNDAGVHIVHRYRDEGPGSILKVLRSTGEHVFMGSITTMIGFAGLAFSFHPGIYSIGVLAVVGIGSTLLAALVFLPALLQLTEKKGA